MPIKTERPDSGYDIVNTSTQHHVTQPRRLKRERNEDSEEPLTAAARKVPRTLPNPSAHDDSVAGDDSSINIARGILNAKFGYKSFRHQQELVISKILSGDNALVVFPTGAGKSLCYQIPAIAFEQIDTQNGEREPGESGVTIVVCPLIALMKDQVDALKRKGVAADCIDSTKTWEELQEVDKALREGRLRLLYCAPERLNDEGFIARMQSVRGGVRLVAVDEAHCISEWGYSFRPDYLKVARFTKEIQAERVICLTATATPLVAKDICSAFDITRDGVFRTSPYRPNLRLEVEAVADMDQKLMLIRSFLGRNPGSTLVYVIVQKEAEAVAGLLVDEGFKAIYFHAGMRISEKKKAQEDFMASKIDIVVATIAFGMGIDKSEIRNIVHWDFPSTIEEYCQQIGRAGRDGKPSQCVLFLCREDFYMKEYFARGDLPSLKSLKRLLRDIFSDKVMQLSPGDTFKTSHYTQGNEFDMRLSPLGIIYAILELKFNLIRAITPEYTSYKFEAMPNFLYYLRNNSSPEAKAILRYSTLARKLYSINLSEVAGATGLHRTDLVNLLNRLEERGAIKLTVSGLQQKYKIMSKLPENDDEINTLAEELYSVLEKRENQALARMYDIVGLLTAPQCLARSVSAHFGMRLPGGKTACGHCTFCLDGAPAELPPDSPKPIDHSSIRDVLEATDVRDDARFLARVAFGIISPRVRKLKLHEHSAFRSMRDQDFDLILQAFKNVCGETE